MPTFTYQVRDEKGKKVTGELEATSEKALADRLSRDGYLVTSIKTARPFFWAPILGEWGERVPMSEMTMFYFQLGNMVGAGVALLQSLRSAHRQIEHRTLKRAVADLADRVERGERLSEAMTRHAKLFPLLYRTMIEVGESSGNLDEVLRHVAELNEHREELIHQVRSALAYPVVLLLASIGVMTFMVLWLVPSFTVLFERSGIPLPLPTRILYGLSIWVKSHLIWLFGGSAALGLGWNFAFRFEAVKGSWDRFWLSVPVAGLLLRRIEIARWSRSFALMVSSGVPILRTLEVTRNVPQTRPFQAVLERAVERVQQGDQLAETLSWRGVFSDDVIQMVSTGENSGTLDKMLYKVAGFYDQLIQRNFKQLTSVIEPIFILFMGFIVGFIMISLLLPIFDMVKVFSSR